MDNGKAELVLIGQIVTCLSYTIKHQNISVIQVIVKHRHV